MSDWSQPQDPHGTPDPYGPGQPAQPAYGGGQPGAPYGPGWPAQPGYGAAPPQWPPAYGAPPPGWPPGYGRFDPADPLISADYAGWWQRSTAIIKAGWRPLLVLQLIGVGIAFVLQAPAQIFQDLRVADLQLSGARPDAGWLAGVFGPVLVAALLAGLVSILVNLASVRMVVAVATGGVPSSGHALRGAVRRLLPMVGWSLVAALIGLVAVLACFLPVFYVAAVFVVLPAVVVFERGGAIARCFRLFHVDLGASVARVATVAGIAVGAVVVGFVVQVLIQVAFTGGALADPGVTPGTASTIASGMLGLLLQSALTAGLGVVLTPLIVAAYADLRARHEPLTTGTLVQELDA
jgi:hypothetical protein